MYMYLLSRRRKNLPFFSSFVKNLLVILVDDNIAIDEGSFYLIGLSGLDALFGVNAGISEGAYLLQEERQFCFFA